MKTLLLILTSLFISFSVSANVELGQKAPDFKLMGHDGKEYSLGDYKGQVVVLEWFNQGCPFVKKHYNSNNMQSLQKEFKEKVTWLSISSSASGKQGYLAGKDEAANQFAKSNMKAAALLLDPSGDTGRAYAAVTTPHMYIINKKGELVYNGAIDSIPSTDEDDVSKATPLFKNALNAVLSGKKVPKARNQPYGCSVKY